VFAVIELPSFTTVPAENPHGGYSSAMPGSPAPIQAFTWAAVLPVLQTFLVRGCVAEARLINVRVPQHLIWASMSGAALCLQGRPDDGRHDKWVIMCGSGFDHSGPVPDKQAGAALVYTSDSPISSEWLAQSE